jgi:hypothetical protein
MIRLLFTLYIFFLSVYPCKDKETCLDEQRAGIAFTENGNHNYSNAEQDFCTPFCICSCCAAHIQLNHLSGFSFALQVHNTRQATRYFERFSPGSETAIWQPPKL